MDIIQTAEQIFGVKAQDMTIDEMKAARVAGEDCLVYQVNWDKRTVKCLLTRKKNHVIPITR